MTGVQAMWVEWVSRQHNSWHPSDNRNFFDLVLTLHLPLFLFGCYGLIYWFTPVR